MYEVPGGDLDILLERGPLEYGQMIKEYIKMKQKTGLSPFFESLLDPKHVTYQPVKG